jgi:hypothetical protein
MVWLDDWSGVRIGNGVIGLEFQLDLVLLL